MRRTEVAIQTQNGQTLSNKIFQHSKPVTLPLLIVIIASVVQSILIVAQAKYLSQIIHEVFLNDQGLDDVWVLLIYLLIIFALRALVLYVTDTFASNAADKLKKSLRTLLMSHIYKFDKEIADRYERGKLLAITYDSVEALGGFIGQYIPQVALAVLIPITILFFVIPADLVSTIILLVTFPLMPIFMYLIGSTAEKITKRQWETLAYMRSFFSDMIQGLQTIIQHNQHEAYLSKIQSVGERYRKVTLNILKTTFMSAFALEFIATMSTALVAVSIGLRLLRGNLDFQLAFFILVITPEFYYPLRQLGMRFHAGITGKQAFEQIFTIIDTPIPDESFSTATGSTLGTHSQPITIKLEGVSYRYPDRETDAFQDISMIIQPEEKIALIGLSGSGKSTLINVLSGLSTKYTGKILINNEDLRYIPLEEWRMMVSWIPQTPFLFTGTIAENILIGNPEASQSDIRSSAQKAYIDDFIQSLPSKYETQVGENGIFLSGGQIQRIALARAFIKNSPIICMDEPTSHIDLELEEQLIHSIKQLSIGRTVITIAHRLSTVTNADRIYVMELGKIIEFGSHAELLSLQGTYHKMFTAIIRNGS